jgi:hypothetical protein
MLLKVCDPQPDPDSPVEPHPSDRTKPHRGSSVGDTPRSQSHRSPYPGLAAVREVFPLLGPAARNLVAGLTYRLCTLHFAALVSGASGVWRSLVARPLWERKVVGSNPATPTKVRGDGTLGNDRIGCTCRLR